MKDYVTHGLIWATTTDEIVGILGYQWNRMTDDRKTFGQD